MKRFLSLMLSLMLVLGCVAATAAAEENVTFTWLINKVEVQNQLETLAQMYMDSHPGVTIITEVAGGSVEPYATRLKAKMNSDDQPAIFVVEGPSDIETFADYIADLTDDPMVAEIMDGLLDNVTTAEGRVMALPLSVEGYGLIYNRAILEAAGIDPATIVDFATLKAAAETLDSKKAELGLDAVFSIPGKETWITGSHMSTAFLNGEFATPMAAWTSKTTELSHWDALKQFVDLQADYSLKEGETRQALVSKTYADQIEAGFAIGKVAMVHNGSWVAPILAEIAPEMLEGDQIGFLPIPVEGYRTDSVVVGGTPYVAFNKALPQNVQDAAKDFYHWMYSDETAVAYVLNDLQFIPPFKTLDASLVSNPLARDLLKYMSEGKTLSMMYLGTPTGWKSYTGEKLQEYFTGRSWEDCMDDLKAKWTELAK